MEVKKLVLVLATSTLNASAREEALKRDLYIHYLVQFQDTNKTKVQTLVNSKSKINTIHLSFAKQLGLPIRPTNVKRHKIDGTTLDPHEIVVAVFLVVDKINRVKFFEVTFLVANVSLEVVFRMLFLILSSADVDFSSRKLR